MITSTNKISLLLRQDIANDYSKYILRTKNELKFLTDRQKEVYNFMWSIEKWNPPTFKQMRNHLGVKSNQTVADLIKNIKRKGYTLPTHHNPTL